MRNLSSYIYLFFVAILFCNSCEKTQEETPSEDVEEVSKYYIDAIFEEYYYWYSQKPTGLDKSSYDLFSYFDASLVSKDRWSWMETKEDWIASQTGVYLTYGASLAQPLEYYGRYDVMVRFVFPDSPFALNGVKRGWTMTHLAGQPVMDLIYAGTFNEELSKLSNSFVFNDENGVSHSFEASAASVSTHSYIDKRIFTPDDFPGLPFNVGYFNYLTFNANMLEDIINTCQEFLSAGISEMILDLRYNGGGDIIASSLLANCLAPASAEGQILVRRQHNDKHSDLDEESTVYIERNDYSLSLNRLFIITGNASASASEMLVNGLRPLLPENSLIQVGDTTHGKPCGMYVFAYPNGTDDDYYANAQYIFYPICFFSVNKDGNGDYEDGLLPDQYWPDDLYHDWGVSESSINACLTYISTGSFPPLPSLSTPSKSSNASRTSTVFSPVRLPLPEDSPDYGCDVLLPPKR